MLNAQLPLSCIAAFTHNTESECRTYCSHTKPIPYSNAIDQMVPHLQFAIHLHLAHTALSKTKCKSTRQILIWCTAMSYLQSLLDNTCPKLQHGRFSETCQIPHQLLPSCLKLLRDLVSSVTSKTWFGHPKSKLTQDELTQDDLCNLLNN